MKGKCKRVLSVMRQKSVLTTNDHSGGCGLDDGFLCVRAERIKFLSLSYTQRETCSFPKPHSFPEASECIMLHAKFIVKQIERQIVTIQNL